MLESSVPRLLGSLESLSFDDAMSSRGATFLNAILNCVDKIVAKSSESSDADYAKALQSIGEVVVPKLVFLVVRFVCLLATQQSPATADVFVLFAKSVESIRKIVLNICRVADETFQAKMIASIVSLALGAPFTDASVFAGAFAKADARLLELLAHTPFHLFVTSLARQIAGRPAAHYLLPIFTAIVGCRRPSVAIVREEEVIRGLTSLVFWDGACDAVLLSSCQCLATVLNKLKSPDTFTDTIVRSQFLGTARDNAHPASHRARAVQAFSWATKALTIRSHPLSSELGNELTKLLSDLSVAPAAAAGFDVVMGDCDIILNAKSNAVTSVLFRQRFFHQQSTYLLEALKQDNSAQKRPYYLLALSNLCQHVPLSALKSKLETIFPLLLVSLSSEFAEARASMLTTLTKLLKEDIQVAESYVNEIVKSLLEVLKMQPNMNVRISVLSCFQSLLKLPFHLIFPYRPQVIAGVTPLLDDRKREVRKRAIACRNKWFAVKG